MAVYRTHETQTFTYYDHDRARRATLAPFVPVVVWNHGANPNPNIHIDGTLVSLPNPTTHYADYDEGSGNAIFICTQPVVGITSHFALDGYQVAVHVDGVAPLIVNTQVNAGDVLVVGTPSGVTDANARVYTRLSSQSPFDRVPMLKPIIHPIFGKEFTFLLPSIIALSGANATAAFNRTAANQSKWFFPIGYALRGTVGDPSTTPQVIPVRLTPHMFRV